MKINLSHVLLGCFLVAVESGFSYPRIASECFPPDAIGEISYLHFKQLMCFPHQVAVSDLIFCGTVLSTNNGYSAQFAIDEQVWGSPSSSNIVIRRVDTSKPTGFIPNDRYLVMAFTNDWWHGKEELSYTALINLYNYHSLTNRPEDNAVFSDYRIMDPSGSAINFKDICYNGTNYWDGTRTFITNYIELAKIQNDEEKAIKNLCSLLYKTNEFRRLPYGLRRQIISYKYLHHDI